MRPYKKIKVFENPILEWFSHIHPISPLLLWIPVIGYLGWKSAMLPSDLTEILSLVFCGLMAWTLTEYLLHRFIFHWEGENRFSKFFHFIVHGIHHIEPNDPTRLLMPPILSGALGIMFYGLFLGLLGSVFVIPFFAGFATGYLIYDYIHFATHFYHPKSKVGKYLKRNHMSHHFIDPNKNWGVSTPLWDKIFFSESPQGKFYNIK